MRQDNGPLRPSPVSCRRDERRKGDLEVHTDTFYMMEVRVLREHDLAEHVAGRNRYARSKRNPGARMARRLFRLALTAEETRRVVWERLEAKGHLQVEHGG